MENNETKKNEQEFRELSDEELSQVTGGGVPYTGGFDPNAIFKFDNEVASAEFGNPLYHLK